MNLIRGFSEFRKQVGKTDIQYKWERVKKPNWSVYYCVYTIPMYEDKLREYVDAYNRSKSNRSYINLYSYIPAEFVKIKSDEICQIKH